VQAVKWWGGAQVEGGVQGEGQSQPVWGGAGSVSSSHSPPPREEALLCGEAG